MVLIFSVHYAFGIFFRPVVTEFGWTRAMTSGAFSLVWISQGVVSILMGGLNDRFEPAATPYDWLTRDAAEVQKYVDDPWCGFERMAARPAAAAAVSSEPDDSSVPSDLPLLIFNGADDPIGGDEGGRALADHYRAAGVADVTFRSYEGARHELFNETNRDEVTADVLGWLASRISSPSRRRS